MPEFSIFRLAMAGAFCAMVASCGGTSTSPSVTDLQPADIADIASSQATPTLNPAQSNDPVEEGDESTLPITPVQFLTADEVNRHSFLALSDLERITGDLSVLAEASIPTAAAASFTGPSVLIVSSPVSENGMETKHLEFPMLGTADIDVDFEAGVFDGRVQDMFATTTDFGVSSVDGSLRIQEGEVTADTNQLSAAARGTLIAYDTEYTFDIPLGGSLFGTDETVDAISLNGLAPVEGAPGHMSELVIVGDANAADGAYVNR